MEEHGLTSLQIQLDDDAIMAMIRYYTKEAGVRELDRVIASLFRKIVKKVYAGKRTSFLSYSRKGFGKVSWEEEI